MARQQTNAPVRPTALRTRYDRTANDVHIVFRKRTWGNVFGLLLVLAVWSGACWLIVAHVTQDPKLIDILFGSVFGIAWVFIFLFLFSTLFGCDELRANEIELVYSYWLFLELVRKRVPVDEIKSIAVAHWLESSDSKKRQSGIEIQTFGQPIKLCVGVPLPELDWLVAQLVDVTKIGRRVQPSDDATVIRAGGFEQSLSIVEPPSDCAWQMRHEFDGIEFYQRGRFSIAALLGSLCLTAFWNGIVSVFVLNLLGFGEHPPRGLEWLTTALFLIPFILVGLLFVFLVLLTILEPIRVTTWRFSSNRIECHWAWLGLGPRWRYEVLSLDRITVKRMEPKFRSSQKAESHQTSDGLRYCVSFVNPNDTELCQFGSLTEGEAIWIAENVRPILPLAS